MVSPHLPIKKKKKKVLYTNLDKLPSAFFTHLLIYNICSLQHMRDTQKAK